MDTSQPTAALINSFISAEILDPATDPLGYVLVAEHMVHGPCGELNTKSPCMKNGRCSKNYSKSFHDETSLDENGFPIYRHRNNVRYVIKSNIKLNNRWIVSYNLQLLRKYDAYINIEWCN
jgi:hypothetical protein